MFFSKKYPFLEAGFTTDIHAHILPGVDDGAKDMAHSLAIIRYMQEAGVKKIVLTPHINPEIHPNQETFLVERFAEFKEKLPEDVHIEFYLAAEYMVHAGIIDHIPDGLLCYPDRSVLIEMSYFYRSENIREAIFELNIAGYKPIIAHPERYVFYHEKSYRISELSEMDCRFQLNILSLFGYYGKGSMKMVDFLMKHNLYSYIATDVHTQHQLPEMFCRKTNERTMEKLKILTKNNSLLLR